MSATWSLLTCPPQPPFPVRISDDVFLPVPSPASLRASSSEPSLSFELKGLKMLAKEDGEKEVVKVSETKMRRRNTLLMTPGEVHKLGTLSILPSQINQPVSKVSSCKPIVPKTPQPIRRIASDMSTPSSTYSDGSDSPSNSDYDSCSSSFSTPCSSIKGYKSNIQHQLSSPCPSQPNSKLLDSAFLTEKDYNQGKGTFGQNSTSILKFKSNPNMEIDGLPRTKSTTTSNFKYWRSPKTTIEQNCFSSPIEEEEQGRGRSDNVKRRRISQILWEGMPCPEEFVSPKTKHRVNELGKGFSWATLH